MIHGYINVRPLFNRDEGLKFNPFRDGEGSDERKENGNDIKDEDQASNFVPYDISKCSKEKIEMSIHLFFYHQLIDWYLLKVGNCCRPVRTVRVSTRDRPGDGIVDGLDPRIKIDEVPDGAADGSHPNPSYHPLEGNHLVQLNSFPRILIP
jgi:hypothetical protein